MTVCSLFASLLYVQVEVTATKHTYANQNASIRRNYASMQAVVYVTHRVHTEVWQMYRTPSCTTPVVYVTLRRAHVMGTLVFCCCSVVV